MFFEGLGPFDSEIWGVPQKLNMWYIFYEKFHSDSSLSVCENQLAFLRGI